MNNVSKEDSQGHTVKLHKNKSLTNSYRNHYRNIEYCNIILNEEGINLNDTIFSKTSTKKDIGKTDNKATCKDKETVSINNDNYFKMQSPKECNIIFPQCKWESMKSDICLKNERKILPKHWTNVIAKEIRKIKYFSCCVKFIRHFVQRKDNYLFSFDFGCTTIEDCKMKGKGVLQNNFELKIEFVENKFSQEEGKH